MLVRSLGVTVPTAPLQQINHLFDSVFNAAPHPAAVFPPLNVWQDQENIYVEAELAGVTSENLDIALQDDELTIRGLRLPNVPKDATALRQERRSGKFSRTIMLPLPVEADAIDAKLDGGVLTVTLPKAQSTKPRKIEIKTSRA